LPDHEANAAHCGRCRQNVRQRPQSLRSGLTFARIAKQSKNARPKARQKGVEMSDTFSLLGDIDHLCGQLAAALHHAEWQMYATLALILFLSVLLFPPRNDPDQV
jgi:hypothetical protein